MKKLKYILFILFGIFFFIPVVKAETIVMDSSDFIINGEQYYPGKALFTFYGHQDANTATTIPFVFWYDAVANQYDMSYLILDICSTYPFRATTNNYDCDSNGCLTNPRVYKTNTSCTARTYNGTVYRVYFDILDWEGERGVDESFMLNTRINFYPRSYEEYSRPADIKTGYLSNTDNGADLENATLISGSIDDVNSSVQDTNDKLDTQIEQEKEAEETRKGIWETIKNLPMAFLDMLLGLFIPDDMSFVTDFVDALESKLGFIASVPVQIIEFAINLVTTSWETFDSISFPSISIFGYNFWNSQEVDLTEAINIFKPFKYVTDVICVVLCARTLNKWREAFTGGGS